MKILKSLFVLSVIVASLGSLQCSKDSQQLQMPGKLDPDTLNFENSMKGWELYSWPKGNEWNYSILMGTNRVKSYNEVISNPIAVTGIDSLKMLLDRFAEGQTIFWIGEGWLDRCWGSDYGDLTLPDETIVNEIQAYCALRNLVLNVSD